MLPTLVAGLMMVDGVCRHSRFSQRERPPRGACGQSLAGATGIAVSSDAAYAPEAVTIDRTDVAWQYARAHAGGRVELQGARRLDLPPGADALEIPALLGAVKHEHVPASGTVSMQGTVAGTTVRPRARLRVQGANLAAYSEALGTLAATIQLTDRQVDLTGLELDKPQPDGNGRLVASGSYHLDEGSYQSICIRQSPSRQPDACPMAGRWKIAVTGNGQGTTQAPSADDRSQR